MRMEGLWGGGERIKTPREALRFSLSLVPRRHPSRRGAGMRRSGAVRARARSDRKRKCVGACPEVCGRWRRFRFRRPCGGGSGGSSEASGAHPPSAPRPGRAPPPHRTRSARRTRPGPCRPRRWVPDPGAAESLPPPPGLRMGHAARVASVPRRRRGESGGRTEDGQRGGGRPPGAGVPSGAAPGAGAARGRGTVGPEGGAEEWGSPGYRRRSVGWGLPMTVGSRAGGGWAAACGRRAGARGCGGSVEKRTGNRERRDGGGGGVMVTGAAARPDLGGRSSGGARSQRPQPGAGAAARRRAGRPGQAGGRERRGRPRRRHCNGSPEPRRRACPSQLFTWRYHFKAAAPGRKPRRGQRGAGPPPRRAGLAAFAPDPPGSRALPGRRSVPLPRPQVAPGPAPASRN